MFIEQKKNLILEDSDMVYVEDTPNWQTQSENFFQKTFFKECFNGPARYSVDNQTISVENTRTHQGREVEDPHYLSLHENA